MTYAGVQMFMEKLNQLINCNDIPLISNPAIICERPQFRLLYEELGSMIQTIFINKHQDLHESEKVSDLKRRFIYAAEEAQYIVDLFLLDAHNRKNECFPTSGDFKGSQNHDDVRRSFKSVVNLFLSCVHIRNNEHDFSTPDEDFNPSLNLDDVRRSFKFVEVEFKSMRIDGMKRDSSLRPERTQNQFVDAQSSNSRNLLRSKKLLDEIFVGLDHDAELIRDKLVEDQRKLEVVSVVGMGGIGKTTLATKVFNDGYVKHHFHVRVWVTVSQTYDKRGVLIQILESIRGQLDLEKATNSRLRELVHKQLMGKRYLIVIDDIWHVETWDSLKLFFPHDKNGSRILLTSRVVEVAKHANSHGVILHLGCLNKEKSWELLCQKVFHGNECPEWSIKPGMQIVEKCQGLPLAVVVIAGVLAKEAWSEKFWVEIAEKTSSYIVGDQNGCLEILGLSYNHLPLHLRECFLYLGGFPEDYKFQERRLIWLWVAEGFIQQDGNKSLEDIAEGYLMDLIDRNLVIVSDIRKSNGAIKVFILHDLVRELCLSKSKEEPIGQILSSQFSNVIAPPSKPVRMFINKDSNILGFPSPATQNIRSILWFSGIAMSCFRSCVLLRVLDLQNCRLNEFSEGMEQLVHLRYLAIWNSSLEFPSSICNLWGLQTLIYITKHDHAFLSVDILEQDNIVLPSNISDLVNLRHLWSHIPSTSKTMNKRFILPSAEKPMNLQTISNVVLGNNFQKCFPYIKELTCTTCLDEEKDFKSLIYLEKLKLTAMFTKAGSTLQENIRITFPATLKTLTLEWCGLPWSDMSMIQSLTNLQILKLKDSAFEGSCWNTDEQEFRQLQFLRLEVLNIEEWEAYSRSFPCLKQLEIFSCHDLEEIPLEIGEIPALERIQVKACSLSVEESVRRIQEEQHDLGNDNLKIDILHE